MVNNHPEILSFDKATIFLFRLGRLYDSNRRRIVAEVANYRMGAMSFILVAVYRIVQLKGFLHFWAFQ